MDDLPESIQTLEGFLQHLDLHGEQPLDLELGLRQISAQNSEAEGEAGAAWYWEVALVMKQCLNLRNSLAHRLFLPEEFTPTASDVMFQCLFIPSLLKSNTTWSPEN